MTMKLSPISGSLMTPILAARADILKHQHLQPMNTSKATLHGLDSEAAKIQHVYEISINVNSNK